MTLAYRFRAFLILPLGFPKHGTAAAVRGSWRLSSVTLSLAEGVRATDCRGTLPTRLRRAEGAAHCLLSFWKDSVMPTLLPPLPMLPLSGLMSTERRFQVLPKSPSLRTQVKHEETKFSTFKLAMSCLLRQVCIHSLAHSLSINSLYVRNGTKIK